MIVIADSGLTKTDWRVVLRDKKVISFETKGLSPFFCDEQDYHNALLSAFPINLNPQEVKKVFFYGSGCAGEEKGYKAQQALQSFFGNANTHAYSDLLAAARSLFGDGKGVIAILGTGSNIAYYNSDNVIHFTPSLGFVLGDEGSGAYIGRKLLQAYFYGNLPSNLSKSFKDRFDLDLSHVLDRVYSQQKPSAYLASFVPFVKENIYNEFMKQLVYSVFERLYEVHLKIIPELKEYGLGVVGSVGFVFQDIIKQIADDKGFEIKGFTQYPIESLVYYHIRKDA
jgi:glucosamine kinase